MAALTEGRGPKGLHKSAVLLLSLGTELAARVLSQMEDSQVEPLIAEMARLGYVEPEERDRIILEFSGRLEGETGGVAGGPDYARRLLEQAVGPERAQRILNGPESEGGAVPSLESLLENTPPEALAALMAEEHPQLIALLIGQLSTERAAQLLTALPAEAQGAVAFRLAEMEAPAPIALEHLHRCLLGKLQQQPETAAQGQPPGPRRVADILGRMRRTVENLVLASLEQQSPEVAQKVNQYRFTFENLLELEPRSVQRVLRDVEADTLKLAMKGLDEEQQQVIFSNMSERAAARLREDLETTGPTALREVEGAQQTIVGIARALMESGEVQYRFGGSEEEEETVV